jgi:hypothetical protein
MRVFECLVTNNVPVTAHWAESTLRPWNLVIRRMQAFKLLYLLSIPPLIHYVTFFTVLNNHNIKMLCVLISFKRRDCRNCCLLKKGPIFGQFSQTFCLIGLTFFTKRKESYYNLREDHTTKCYPLLESTNNNNNHSLDATERVVTMPSPITTKSCKIVHKWVSVHYANLVRPISV